MPNQGLTEEEQPIREKDGVAEENQSQNTEEKKKQEEESKKVSIDKNELQGLFDRIKRLEEGGSDKAGLAYYDERNQKLEDKYVDIKKYNNGFVISYRLIENTVEQNPNTGNFTENQIIEVKYLSGKTEQANYVIFYRNFQRVPARVLQETENKDEEERKKYGDKVFKVEEQQTGEIFSIGSKYIN